MYPGNSGLSSGLDWKDNSYDGQEKGSVDQAGGFFSICSCLLSFFCTEPRCRVPRVEVVSQRQGIDPQVREPDMKESELSLFQRN